MNQIKIGSKYLGTGHPVMIVGELSGNHRGSLDIAMDSIKKMKECGLDAVKIQTLKPGSITLDLMTEDFVVKGGTLWDGKSYFSLYSDIYTPWEWTIPLMELANSLGMEFFSSPFGMEEVDFLEQCNIAAYKIASFEITDIPLIEYVASKGKPIIISTGIAEKEDIQLAIDACLKMDNEQIVILKCTSSYPTPIEEMNLSLISKIRSDFNIEVGLSDHTLDHTASIVATSLGAVLIEKHFILDKNLGGPDAEFSMEPEQWKSLVKSVREVELALGKPTYVLSEKVKKSRSHSRSLYIVKDVKKGDLISIENVRSIRPGFGMHPKYLKDIIGKKFLKDYNEGDRMGFTKISTNE